MKKYNLIGLFESGHRKSTQVIHPTEEELIKSFISSKEDPYFVQITAEERVFEAKITALEKDINQNDSLSFSGFIKVPQEVYHRGFNWFEIIQLPEMKEVTPITSLSDLHKLDTANPANPVDNY